MITHSSRPGLVTSKIPLPSKLQVPGSASSLLEFRFGEAGRDAIGLVVQVPHYLSQAAYPTAALTLIDALTEVTGLDLPALELREAADRTNALIDRQVEESSEVAELVQGALDQVRSERLKVIANCPFVKAWIGKHEEYKDLLKA